MIHFKIFQLFFIETYQTNNNSLVLDLKVEKPFFYSHLELTLLKETTLNSYVKLNVCYIRRTL